MAKLTWLRTFSTGQVYATITKLKKEDAHGGIVSGAMMAAPRKAVEESMFKIA